MKTIKIRTLLAAVIAVMMTACGASNSKENETLAMQSQLLSAKLTALADNSPMFLQDAQAEYAADTLGVTIALADETLSVSQISEPLVQYVVAQYMKANTGKNLDETVNALVKIKGMLAINLVDADGQSHKYDIPAARLVKLIKLKPMELNFSDVRANVLDILDARCNAYKEQYKAEACEFTVLGNFAQYTLTFARATAYAQLNQASLTGRYVKILKATYETYGACRPMVEELLRSLNIEGYRFIYTDPSGKKITAGIPWKTLN